MSYAVARQQQNTSTTGAAQTTAGSDASKNQLRGMSYAEGVAALSPDAVQMMPASGQQTAAGTVQLKGVDYVKKKGLPDEIKALGLKKVKVKIEEGAWDHLEDDEKQGVINFLTMKEAEILSATNKKSKYRIKSSTVTITDSHVRALDDDELVDLEAGANKNLDNLNAGEKPESVGPRGKVIGVDPGDVTVEQSYTTQTTTVSGKEKVTKEADFKSGESTFLSAEYTQEKMLDNANIMQLMEDVKAQIEAYLAQDPKAKITVGIQGSESWVTPPASHPNRGDLAQARADNGEQLVKSYLASVEGLDLANVEFTKENLGVQGPKWDSTGLSKTEVQKLKMDPMYTKWQYVNFKVTAEMSVESKDKTPVTTTTVDETSTTEADVVKMGVTEKKKGMHGGGSNSFSVGNKGRVRGDGLVKGWKKAINGNSCDGAK